MVIACYFTLGNERYSICTKKEKKKKDDGEARESVGYISAE